MSAYKRRGLTGKKEKEESRSSSGDQTEGFGKKERKKERKNQGEKKREEIKRKSDIRTK